MKTTIRTALLLCILSSLTFSCKKSAEQAIAEENAMLADTTMGMPQREFIRTADVRFRVKDVRKSTNAIEKLATQAGGFVTNSDLQSSIVEKRQTRTSKDSMTEVTRFHVENAITIRVPSVKLDTVMNAIAAQVDFLDSRHIKADDAALDILANQLKVKRSLQQSNRMEKATEGKKAKVKEITESENVIAERKDAADAAYINTLSLHDQADFSTISLAIYQRETVAIEKLAYNTVADDVRPAFGFRIMDSMRTGWYVLESLVVLLAGCWILIPVILFLLYRYKTFFFKKI